MFLRQKAYSLYYAEEHTVLENRQYTVVIVLHSKITIPQLRRLWKNKHCSSIQAQLMHYFQIT